MKGAGVLDIRITDSELEVMRLLWREGRALSFGEIRRELEDRTQWSKSTIQTLVVRLRDKGMINAENKYVTLYSSNVSEEEYVRSEGQSFLDKLFDGNAKKLVAALCENGQLNEKDIDDLKGFFKMEDN